MKSGVGETLCRRLTLFDEAEFECISVSSLDETKRCFRVGINFENRFLFIFGRNASRIKLWNYW